MSEPDLEQRCIDVVRGFAMDGPQKANSGHPGTAMALAPLAYTLWTRIMRYDPTAPDWPNRDRFVLSAGHASILLYSMLHLTGYDLTKEDLEDFRQWGSQDPGPPRGPPHRRASRSRPVRSARASATPSGMALAEHHLRARFGEQLFDHHTFVIAGDGCLMEGVSHEAASLAGHLGLDKLVADLRRQPHHIDGPTELALNDDAGARFEAYGWHVDRVGEIANDVDALEAAIRRAMAVEGKPAMIILRSHIGYPSPKVTDSAKAHGDPLGAEEIAHHQGHPRHPPDEPFWEPDRRPRRSTARPAPGGRPSARPGSSSTPSGPTTRTRSTPASPGGACPGWAEKLPDVGGRRRQGRHPQRLRSPASTPSSTSCPASSAAAPTSPATPAPPCPDEAVVLEPRAGRPPAALRRARARHGRGHERHGPPRRHASRSAARSSCSATTCAARCASPRMSESKVIFSFTHDSVGLGEDGPTHQPIEHLASLRAMPELRVIRPADANETAMAWRAAIDGDGADRADPVPPEPADPRGHRRQRGRAPGRLRAAATRCGDDQLDPDRHRQRGRRRPRGRRDPRGPRASAPGSCRCRAGTSSRPRTEDVPGRRSCPPGVQRVSVEAGSTFGWARWADARWASTASAPAPRVLSVLDELGINAANVVEHADALDRLTPDPEPV